MGNEPLEDYKVPHREIELPKEEKVYLKISCPSCDTKVKAADLNINDKIAKCGNCDSIFSFEQEVKHLIRQSPVKKEVAKPVGVDLYHFHDDLDITLAQPPSPLDIILATFSVIFLFLFGLIFLIKGEAFYGMIGALVVAIYPFFQLANRHKHFIYIDVNRDFLNVKWRPKKFHRDVNVPVRHIEQLYVKFIETTNKATLYALIDTGDGQSHVKLLPEINGLTKARYLEQEIERHLGIQDAEVPEETR